MPSPYDKLAVVINPNATNARNNDQRHIEPLRDVLGGRFDLLQTPSASAADNIAFLSEYLTKDDARKRLIIVSGDGVAGQAITAVSQAGTSHDSVGLVAGGGFSDGAAVFTKSHRDHTSLTLTHQGVPTVPLRPLEILINGDPYRTAAFYTTLGWSACAAEVFDSPKFRAAVKQLPLHVRKGLSVLAIGADYLRHRGDGSLPPFTRSPDDSEQHITDIAAINVPIMGGIIRDRTARFAGPYFLGLDIDASRLYRNTELIGKSALNLLLGPCFSLPGTEKSTDTLHFGGDTVPIQVDGETSKRSIDTITIQKSAHAVNIVATRPWTT